MVQMGDPEMLWKRADSARDGKRVQKVRAEDSKWVACQCGGYRKSDAIPKTAIEEIVRLPFEGHLINAPAGYETYLHTLYGDYHQLPPEDQRHPAHVEMPTGVRTEKKADER